MFSDSKKAFIEFMLEAGVLKFGSFITKSGRLTPYFVNTGNYAFGSQLATLGKHYANLIQATRGGGFNAIFGPAYKGIPLATATAAALFTDHGVDVPFFFNRKEAKDHGEGGSLIGYQPKDGDRIAIIEDVITAGTTVRECVPMLKSVAGLRVEDMFISVDRSEIGTDSGRTAVQEVWEDFGVTVHSIVSVLDIRDYLRGEEGYEDVLERMEEYIGQYCRF